MTLASEPMTVPEDRLIATLVPDDFSMDCQKSSSNLRGAIKIIFRKNLGFWPNQRTPPPPPQKLGRQKKKKKFNVYFAF